MINSGIIEQKQSQRYLGLVLKHDTEMKKYRTFPKKLEEAEDTRVTRLLTADSILSKEVTSMASLKTAKLLSDEDFTKVMIHGEDSIFLAKKESLKKKTISASDEYKALEETDFRKKYLSESDYKGYKKDIDKTIESLANSLDDNSKLSDKINGLEEELEEIKSNIRGLQKFKILPTDNPFFEKYHKEAQPA